MSNKISTFVFVAFLATLSNAEDPWTPSPLCPYPSEELTRFPYNGDCSKYWECFEGARYPMDCPQGLEYNEAAHRCDTPSLANCDQDVTHTYPTFPHSDPTTTSNGWTPDPLCPYPSDVVIYYPYAEDCKEYWQCYNGEKYLMKCPSNLYWNVKYNYCDYLENVDCNLNNVTLTPPPTTSPGTGPTTTSGPWTPDPLCPYPSEDITYFIYPYNCSQYWECFEGNKYLMNCPGELVWNDLVKNCDYRDNVDCTRTSTTPSDSSIGTTSSPGTTDAPGTTNTTGTGTVPISTSTSTPTTASPNTTITSTTSEATTTNPTCAGKPDGSFQPNPNDCSHFYECVGGKAIDQKCAGDLVWNQDISNCDYAENVDCKNDFNLYYYMY